MTQKMRHRWENKTNLEPKKLRQRANIDNKKPKKAATDTD